MGNLDLIILRITIIFASTLFLFINSGCQNDDIKKKYSPPSSYDGETNPYQNRGDRPSEELTNEPNKDSNSSSTDAQSKNSNELIKLEIHTDFTDVQSDRPPWSSDYLPYSSEFLYGSSSDETLMTKSVLAKYDRLANSLDRNHQSVWEYYYDFFAHRAKHYDLSEGRCDFLALAAVYEREPQKPLQFGDDCFTPSDLKALLVLTYENTYLVPFDDQTTLYDQLMSNTHGTRYLDEYTGDYNDLDPAHFHHFIVNDFRKNPTPFLIDNDPGKNVWTDAIYRVRYRYYNIDQNNDYIDVELQTFYADYLLSDFQKEQDTLMGIGTQVGLHTYIYRLYGHWEDKNSFIVTTQKKSHWLKNDKHNSEKNHPDYFVILPSLKNAESKKLLPGAFSTSRTNRPSVDYNLVQKILREGTPVLSCPK